MEGFRRIALTVIGLSLATTLYAQAPGDIWTPHEQTRDWQAVASSADGAKLVAVVFGGKVFTSTDWGVTWTPRDAQRYWFSVASSASGSNLVAVDADYNSSSGGYIYTSSDSGVTWTPRESLRRWSAVASSADGTKLVAAANIGLLYTSTDAGVTWFPRDSNRGWVGLASSADGNKLAAVEAYGRIYTSTDAGVTWTPRETPRYWLAIASSADGSKLAAVVYGGQIYTSTDFGVTWTPRESARNWTSITSSADGSVLVAVDYGGLIYISRDSGVSWAPRETARMWYGAATSVDGSSLVAVVAGGQVFTSGRCAGNVADRITFDCVANDTAVNNTYATSYGVTFANPLGGNIYARNAGTFAPSLPNAVSVYPSTTTSLAFFDADSGAVEAHFATPQRAVSIDARPVGPVEFLGTLQNRPFLEAYDSNHNFLGRVLYAGPLPTGCCFEVGPTETLTFTSATANISYARFSSQRSQSALHTYGLFDNLRWFGAAPRLFNTGVDDRGNPLPTGFLQLPDPHYIILAEPSPQIPGPAAVTKTNGWPIAPGAWMANSSVSQWISPHFDENCLSTGGIEPVGTYLYRTTFDTTGFNAAVLSISGRTAADDGVSTILLNGAVVAHPVGAFDTFTPFVLTQGFVPGINTLDFVVTNAAGPACNPSGLRVEVNSSVDSADLSLALTDSPDPVAIGADLTYAMTVTNVGPNAAGSVAVDQQLPSGVTFVSASSSLGSCNLSGSVVTCALGTMSANATATLSVVVRPTAAGTLVTTATVAAGLADPNPGNNSKNASTTVQANGIDLVETAISNPPASVARGGSFGVTETVANVGSMAAGASMTRYYLSADTLRNSGDLLLTGSRSVPSLAAGTTSTGPASLTVPTSAKGGSFYLLACADDTKVVSETNETNNCVASASAVQVIGPDLSVTALSNPPPSLVLPATMTVTDTTTNIGTEAAASSITRYYFSVNAVKDTGDVLLSGTHVTGVLNPGVSNSLQVSVAVPAGTAAGTYYVLACADNTAVVKELDETNNCRASQTTVQFSGPDLRATLVSAPATAVAGIAFAVQDTTGNLGTATAAASVTRYYLSLDAAKNSGDKLLTGTRSVPMLPAGQNSVGASVNVTIPAGTAAGTYWLLACADDTVLVTETAESNNCIASAATVQVSGPDLVETAVSFAVGSVAVGQTFTASDTVLNQGNAAAGASVTRYLLSADTIRNSGDKLLTGNRSVLAAAAGQSQSGSATLTVPSTTTPGTYYLLACSDDTKLVPETVETNNCRASATTITVTP